MKNGGKRTGSGRPKGSLNRKTIKDIEAHSVVVEHFLKKWEPIAETMLSIALGETKIIEYKGKTMRVYTRPPDTRMLQVIVETVIGKPKQPINGIVNMPELQQLSSDIRSILTTGTT